jgi:hypothetical protein
MSFLFPLLFHSSREPRKEIAVNMIERTHHAWGGNSLILIYLRLKKKKEQAASTEGIQHG